MDSINKKYQISFWAFVKTGIPPFIVFVVTVILFIPIMKLTYGSDKQTGAWLVGIFMICINGIPPLILHINYFKNDKCKYLKINKLERTITISENSQKDKINFIDIDRIEKYQSTWLFRMSFRSYYYYRIILRDKTSIYFSRMVIERLENKLDNIDFEYIGVFYPFIRKIN